MADLFISYAREDRPRAEAIANALKALGFDVFWDTEIPPGQTWADYIESKLRQSRAMVVLWSAASTASQWVREEARIGRDAQKLIPVMLDNSMPPFGFGEVQAANLSTWTGASDHPDWLRFVNALRSVTGRSEADGPKPPPVFQTGFAPQGGPGGGFGQQPTFQQQAQPQGQWGQQPPQNPGYNPQPAAFQTSFGGGGPAVGLAAPAQKLSAAGYVQKCLKLYADGKGRASRSEFWWFFLFAIVVYVVAYIADAALFGVGYDGSLLAPVLSLILSLGLMAPSFAVASRRLHDAGMSGWIAVAMLIPLVGIIFGLLPSQPQANQYGPPTV